MVQKVSPRGRPRSFDPEQVLASVRDTFWKHGYAATSMDQLASAAGLHKPSLYGAFGDKRRLYLQTLDRYLAEVSEQFGAALSKPKLMDSLRDFFERSIVLFTQDGATGCFMMHTAVPVANDDPELSEKVRGALDSLDRAMVRRFRRAADEGELPEGVDPETLAMLVIAHHYELSGRARAGYSRETLRATAARTLGLVKQVGRVSDA